MTLSAREREVLTLCASGMTDEQSARKMRIALGTFRTFVRRARAKLGTVDQVTDVLEAIRRGEIHVEGVAAVGR